MSGAPFNNAQGDINKFLLSEVSDVKTTLGEIKGDIGSIKEYIKNHETDQERKFTIKHGIFIAIIPAAITLAIHYLLGGGL